MDTSSRPQVGYIIALDPITRAQEAPHPPSVGDHVRFTDGQFARRFGSVLALPGEDMLYEIELFYEPDEHLPEPFPVTCFSHPDSFVVQTEHTGATDRARISTVLVDGALIYVQLPTEEQFVATFPGFDPPSSGDAIRLRHTPQAGYVYDGPAPEQLHGPVARVSRCIRSEMLCRVYVHGGEELVVYAGRFELQELENHFVTLDPSRRLIVLDLGRS